MKNNKKSLKTSLNCNRYKKRMDNHKRDDTWNNKAQLTILIILAIVIVAGIATFLILRGGFAFGGPPKELQPVHTYYLNCIEQETQAAAVILGQQGGYIEGPEFSPGSAFMPFSSHLGFLGVGIPYWYYISGNGITKEQKPTKENMEEELNKFLEESIINCDFSGFREQGFEVTVGEDIEVKTKINNNKINVKVTQNLAISTANSSWTGKKHSKEIDSNLGKFYKLSEKIYNDFKETMFLENYGVDILRLYAPVDGVEISCSPQIWNVEKVRENLTLALEANIPFTKIKGNYYNLKNKENEYFVHDIPAIGKADVNINFLFSRNWPNKMEVWPTENNLLIAEPIGLQEGLGMLGFCYVPYHFVYDLAYPVLIQMYYNDEIFQFPVVVSINKNRPREPIEGTSLQNVVPELCQYQNTAITVSTYNINLEPIEANIKFKCFDTTCPIGNTKTSETGDATLTENFPQCGNGYVIASAEGYETKKQLLTTINPTSTDIFLDREYDLELELTGTNKNELAVITFTKNKKIKTVAYPEQKQVTLSSGQYEIKAYVYSDAEIRLQGSSEQKCIEVPKSGVLGAFGLTEEKCFNLEIPDQTVNQGISAGGTQQYYISESELETANKITLGITNFGKPKKIEDLQINYNRIKTERIIVGFE